MLDSRSQRSLVCAGTTLPCFMGEMEIESDLSDEFAAMGDRFALGAQKCRTRQKKGLRRAFLFYLLAGPGGTRNGLSRHEPIAGRSSTVVLPVDHSSSLIHGGLTQAL